MPGAATEVEQPPAVGAQPLHHTGVPSQRNAIPRKLPLLVVLFVERLGLHRAGLLALTPVDILG